MLVPPRPKTPVLVLDRQLIRTSNLATNQVLNDLGGKGLVERDGLRREQPQEMMKGTDRIPSTGQELPPPLPLAMSSATQASPARTIYTVSVLSTPAATLIPEGGARADIEELPGQNTNKPSLDGAKTEAGALPGVNQDTSNMGELLKSGTPVNPKEPSATPAVTVNRPLPGQNQASPIMGELAPLLVPSPPPPSSTLVDNPSSPPLSFSAPTSSLVLSTKTSTVLSDSERSIQTSLAISPSTFTPLPVTSFVTITRSNQDKEEAQVPTALTSAFPISAASASINPTDNATPQAVAVVQSISGILSSTTVIATATLTPTVITSNQQGGSILHPTARTLLILFVILGALSILVAIVVCMMVRSHKRNSRAQKQAVTNQAPYDASSSGVGVTTHISANPNDNPFLTASEKAIIDRAASPDRASDVNNASSISDAITSFINKSRRLTYKISP